MAQKHLKELLKEDQEPFHLKDYIAERQCQVNKQPQRTQIQLKKPKPMSKSKTFSCKNACFFSLQDSPDLRKSPLFEFASKSPCKSPNRVFLHVPAKTAALLLEAAMRIQKPKTQIKNSGFGLFGSMLRRLTLRSRAQKLKGSETEEREKAGENRGSVILVGVDEKDTSHPSSSSSSSSSLSSCNGRQSSMDLESSSSGRSFEEEEDDENDDDGFEFANVEKENGICLSPLSPFRFALHRSPSPDRRSPPFFSPEKSPSHCKTQDNRNYEEQQSSVKLVEDDDEEDKEQNSPVSVLDPPFEDDDYDGQEDDDGYGLECSYAFVQRAKQQLLHKLRRFEKLAELDPIELEKILIEEDEERLVSSGGDQAHDQGYEYESFMLNEQRRVDELIDDIVRKTGFLEIKKPGFRRLVSDIIIVEESAQNDSDRQQLIERVCKRLESWKEVESNTIDMMVGMDLRRETLDWKNPREQIGEAAMDIEVGIFATLVKELLDDISNSTNLAMQSCLEV